MGQAGLVHGALLQQACLVHGALLLPEVLLQTGLVHGVLLQDAKRFGCKD